MNISSSSIVLSIADFRTQMLGSLMNLGSDTSSSFGDIMSQFQAGGGNSPAALKSNASVGANTASASAGLNMSLRDPQSAYTMMTKINALDVTYKSQYSELTTMESYLPRIEEAVQQLGKTAVTDGNDSIKAKLQDFAQQYNAWVQRFKPDVQSGGVLANTQAGELPLYELDQVIENRFIGAKDGFNGLADMGISVDANTGLMSVNTSLLDAALANNKSAVVDAVGEFSTKFAASAHLLASDDNFIQHRLNNLNSAVTYIDGNTGSWQKEFGSGDAASPVGKIAQALAAYNKTTGM
ncbi:MAG: flagellar filament capping protein FliD [Proteobacteria bacterium]|nr:flagellar filament capping protein FliD [Pseudomonadota bacterium]